STPGSPTLQLNGGTIHGLGPGAQVDLYPPGTASFAAGQRLGTAVVDTASAVSSTAHVQGAVAVPDGARARLVKPSAQTRPLSVLLTNLPAGTADAVWQAEGAQAFLTKASASAPPEVEVRPWPPDQPNGFALVPYSTVAG